ncbi:hypothetical protein [Woodsholea maritima]|uniref:hypothetical protein n=1 Tax=Woodsholea maritima TaxID=240237 RepID=UPI0003657B9F|nr:hypothetical protein [Woodsholea maritima]
MIAVSLHLVATSLALLQASPVQGETAKPSAKPITLQAPNETLHTPDALPVDQAQCVENGAGEARFEMRQRVVIVSHQSGAEPQIIERQTRTRWGCAPGAHQETGAAVESEPALTPQWVVNATPNPRPRPRH